MPRQLPIQDGRQFYLLHQGQEHHKVIDALRCYLQLFFHALQYARKFRFCLAHYANGEYTCCICRNYQRRRDSQAVSFNQRKRQHAQGKNTCSLPWKIKASSSLRSRWSNRTGGEQKTEDTDGQIDQEDAAPPKRIDQHTTKQRTRKGPDACNCCPDANRLRPFPCVSIDRI